MSRNINRRIHALLDGEADPSACTPAEKATLAKYGEALGRLQHMRAQAPAGLDARIMASLPESRRPSLREWLEGFLPQPRQWAVPALAGAAAMLVAMAGIWHVTRTLRPPEVLVHFQFHAPDAQRVELVGDFNNWTPGTIRLRGPDASGHWTVNLDLPEGRYEYLFLVDGKTWATDPNAAAHRPDGFGRDNAVMDVYEERS